MAAGSVSSHKRPSIVKVNEIVKKTERWDVYASGRQNLAAALNDPQNREVDLFTKTWGEAFVPNAPLPPSNIPHVTKEHFKEYMKLTRQVILYYGLTWKCLSVVHNNLRLYVLICGDTARILILGFQFY